VQDNIGFFAHGTKHLAAGERRTDRVSIRAGVRSQQESVALLDLFENLAQHIYLTLRYRLDCGRRHPRPDYVLRRPSSIVELSTPFLIAFQQLINPGRVRLRAVQLKIQLWRTAQVQTLRDFTADETNCCRQSLQRAFSFFIIALDYHEDPGRARVASELHAAYARQSDAGVAELAFHDGLNLLAQSLAQPFPVIFSPTLFHCFSLRVKRMRISENCLHQQPQNPDRLSSIILSPPNGNVKMSPHSWRADRYLARYLGYTPPF
jgi:hypothetical protein